MQMIPVASTAIASVGYDSRNMRMRICFKEGHSYDFCGVPQRVFDSLMQSASKGTYYANHIRDRYQC